MPDSPIATLNTGSMFQALEAELQRCLRLLASRVPDHEFRDHLPRIVIKDGYAPLPEESVHESESHRITLCTRGDLNRPVDQVLTILLHKAVHAANAFRWKRDWSVDPGYGPVFRDMEGKLATSLTNLVASDRRLMAAIGWESTLRKEHNEKSEEQGFRLARLRKRSRKTKP